MFKNQIHDMDAWVEERLSDYLDGTLSPQEREMFEAHLQTSERARASLESLRWTLSLLKQTPAPPLPRQFTLPVTQRAAARSAPGWMVWALRGVAVAATAAFVILLVGTVLRQPSNENAAMMQQAVPVEQPSVMVALAPTTAPEQPPAAAPAQENAADTANASTPIMITVQAPSTNAPPQSQAQTQPTARAAQAPAQPQPTQTTQSQKAAPPPPTARANKAQPTQAPAALEVSPSPAAAGAGSAADAAPEFATASATATDDLMTQSTFVAQGVDGVITAELLKVRAGPGAQYRTIAILKRDDHVLLVGQSETPGWLAIQVELDDVFIEGWIAARFVEPGGPVDNLPILAPPVNETPESAPATPEATETPLPTRPSDGSETPPGDESPATPTSTPEG